MSRGRSPQSIRGTVLHVRNYGESDRILELLTVEHGRLAVLARGGRASRRRFAGALDLFIELNARVIAGVNLWTLQAADVVTPRIGIRRCLDRIRRASILCDCARSLTPEHSESVAMYQAVTEGLSSLDEGNLPAAAMAYPQILRAAGILPDVSLCARCGGTNSLGAIDPFQGALCRGCVPPEEALPPRVADVFSGGPCGEEETARAIEMRSTNLIAHHVGRPLRTTRPSVSA